MAYFDEKQKNLIRSWHHRSLQTDDNYFAFMAEWIAFNAICYNLYNKMARKYRANIESSSRIDKIEQQFGEGSKLEIKSGYLSMNSNMLRLDLRFPDKLILSIKRLFTEDNIFNEFVRSNKNNEELFPEILFENMKKALQKKDRYYVVNMVNLDRYQPDGDIDQMAEKNVIVLCEKRNLATIRKVLYQIRCNIFHGEKIPGEINDDRIVKKALPLLRHIVKSLMKQYKI